MELATPEAFEADAEQVWRFYEWRRAPLREARPNAGHEALARIETLLPRMTLITQNVDGLHRARREPQRPRAARHDPPDALHGLRRAREPAPDAPFPSLPPRCACGSLPQARRRLVRRELLPEGVFEAAAAAAEESAVFLVVGTSSVVAPASTLAATASRAGAKVFEINPEETPLAPLADGSFRASASAVLPVLADALERGAA